MRDVAGGTMWVDKLIEGHRLQWKDRPWEIEAVKLAKPAYWHGRREKFRRSSSRQQVSVAGCRCSCGTLFPATVMDHPRGALVIRDCPCGRTMVSSYTVVGHEISA